jgi:biotin-(acetyl-CoA carboxylase) ligase
MYTLDPTAAKQADQTGKFIKETGKYKGRFTKAEALTASTGTQGIAFTFESDEKQVANFSIYTMRANGERLPSFQVLMALMACMRLRNISNPVKGVATKYDFDAKADVQYEADLLMDLMNKPIGVLLQSCEYEKQKDRVPTGEYGWKIELQGAFEASTELTASEILNGKTKPELLANMVAHLADRPLKNKGVQRTAQPVTAGGPGDFDDDIPFAAMPRRAWAVL